MSHLGAVVNFVAGTMKRAPKWMQRVGLEWLWRIKQEPSLWRRYFYDGYALLILLVTRVLPYALYRMRNRPKDSDLANARAEIASGGLDTVVRLRGAWTYKNLAQLRERFVTAVELRDDIRLDMGGLTHVDSAFVGLLALLDAQLKRDCKKMQFCSVPESVRRVMKFCCAEYLASA